MTDEEKYVWSAIGWNFASHGHGQPYQGRIRAREKNLHTNTVEGFFSILKRGVYGVYQHVSEAHLHRYLKRVRFPLQHRERLGVNDVARASRALAGAKGRASLTKQLCSMGAKAERYDRPRKRHWLWSNHTTTGISIQ